MMSAREFALQAHGTQKYGDEPYGVHLLAVAKVLIRFGVTRSGPLREAAWLHDVLEDTGVTEGGLAAKFGADVAAIVAAVTDEPGANRKERHIKTYVKIRRYGINAIVLKVADRIANTEYSIAHKSPQLKMYQREFAEFSTALFQSGECDSMWDHLRQITTGEA
jgi:(p)ppGpp synthase/HD superfamily hydrolase